MLGCGVGVGFSMFCTKCGSESVYKSGFVKGAQRYKCKVCGRQFVPTRHHSKTQTEKLMPYSYTQTAYPYASSHN